MPKSSLKSALRNLISIVTVCIACPLAYSADCNDTTQASCMRELLTRSDSALNAVYGRLIAGF